MGCKPDALAAQVELKEFAPHLIMPRSGGSSPSLTTIKSSTCCFAGVVTQEQFPILEPDAGGAQPITVRVLKIVQPNGLKSLVNTNFGCSDWIQSIHLDLFTATLAGSNYSHIACATGP